MQIFCLDANKILGSKQEWEVLIGNRKWMERYGLSIEKDVNEIMKREERLGRIAILAAIDSKI